MEYIVKDVVNQVSDDRKEFFKSVPMTDVSGNTVNILQSVGIYSKADLANQATQLQSQLDDINSKLSMFK